MGSGSLFHCWKLHDEEQTFTRQLRTSTTSSEVDYCFGLQVQLSVDFPMVAFCCAPLGDPSAAVSISVSLAKLKALRRPMCRAILNNTLWWRRAFYSQFLCLLSFCRSATLRRRL